MTQTEPGMGNSKGGASPRPEATASLAAGSVQF